jgi:hypothetical protein
MKSWILLIGPLTMMFADSAFAQHKSSPVHYVTVDRNVKLEVLDWDGSGRAGRYVGGFRGYGSRI